MRRLGWKRDPPDPRDQLAAPTLRAQPEPPASASNRNLIASVLDQGGLGSCTANAAAQALRAAMLREGASNPLLGSRLWLYYLARSYDHDTDKDDGTFLRNVFAAAVKYGLPPEIAWPYDDNASPGAPFSRMPPIEAFREAYDQRAPTTYMRIDSIGDERLDDVRRALAGGYCVVFGTDVSNAFVNNNVQPAVIRPPDGAVAGGHALCMVGYDTLGFDVVNSWGPGWGANGFCKFAPEYITWERTDDLWIVETVPPFVETP